MSIEENKEVVRKVIRAFNERNLALLDTLIAPGYVDHFHNLHGVEEYRQFLTILLAAFPDWHEDIADIIAEGDKVWCRFEARATHTGEFRGPLPSTGKKITLAPTGKRITPTGVIVCRILNDKIVEAWEVSDLLSLYEQLGVIEYKVFPEG